MRTLTEFFGPQLKIAFDTLQQKIAEDASKPAEVAAPAPSDVPSEEAPAAQVEAAPAPQDAPAAAAASKGPTPKKELSDSVKAAFGEAMKAEGDKLKHLLNAIDIAKKRMNGLKRIVVLQLTETEKAPQGAEKRDEFHYLVEYFPGSAPKEKPRFEGRDDRGRKGGRGGKGGKGKGKRGAGRDGGHSEGRDGRDRGGPRPAPVRLEGLPIRKAAAPVVSGAPGSEGAPVEGAAGDAGEKKRRPRRRRRGGGRPPAEDTPDVARAGAPPKPIDFSKLPKPKPKADDASAAPAPAVEPAPQS